MKKKSVAVFRRMTVVLLGAFYGDRWDRSTKSWVSSLCRGCLVVAAVLIGRTALADPPIQDWSGTPAPWPPVSSPNPPPPPGTWVKEAGTSATTYSTVSTGPAIPTPNPAGYLPSPPWGAFNTTSPPFDYGIPYVYRDAGDNFVDSIQTIDIAITASTGMDLGLQVRRQDGSAGTHYLVFVGGTDRLQIMKKVNWQPVSIAVAPPTPAFGKSTMQINKWYRLYFKVRQLSSGCPNNNNPCTQLQATLWDLANPNPPDYTFSSTTPWTLTVFNTEGVLQNRPGRGTLFFRTGPAGKAGYFDNYKVNPYFVVHPVLNCVEQVDATHYDALFGYQNDSATDVTIPIGPENAFSPLPTGRGQIGNFQPGHVDRAFAVRFDGNPLAWSLRGGTATATAQSPACSNTSCATQCAHGEQCIDGHCVSDCGDALCAYPETCSTCGSDCGCSASQVCARDRCGQPARCGIEWKCGSGTSFDMLVDCGSCPSGLTCQGHDCR